MPDKSELSATIAALSELAARSLVETAEEIENRLILSFIKGLDGYEKFMIALSKLDEEVCFAIRQE